MVVFLWIKNMVRAWPDNDEEIILLFSTAIMSLNNKCSILTSNMISNNLHSTMQRSAAFEVYFLFFSCFDKMDTLWMNKRVLYMELKTLLRYNFVTATNCVLSKTVNNEMTTVSHHSFCLSCMSVSTGDKQTWLCCSTICIYIDLHEEDCNNQIKDGGGLDWG